MEKASKEIYNTRYVPPTFTLPLLPRRPSPPPQYLKNHTTQLTPPPTRQILVRQRRPRLLQPSKRPPRLRRPGLPARPRHRLPLRPALCAAVYGNGVDSAVDNGRDVP